MTVPVYLEVTPQKTVAAAMDWPGWCRIGRRAEDAIALLDAARGRYAAVVRQAAASVVGPPAGRMLEVDSGVEGLPDGWPSLDGPFAVTEELAGNATTAFGAPALSPSGDDRPLGPDGLARLVAILRASWAAFDAAAAAATGVELRKGPRGGGRELDAIVRHVREAEMAYATKLGVRLPRADSGAAAREAMVAALEARADGRPVTEPSAARTLWLPSYFVRRAAWHLLDHAWEIEDRAVGD